MSTSDSLKPDTGWVRYLGILTAIGLGVLAFADYILPSRPATIVGALALIVVIIGGSQFLFHGATLVSGALEGWRRTQFQVAVSLAALIAFTLVLASRVDAMPTATLWRMLTPWLLIPLGIIAWVCWFAGGQLNREHPFRGFLIAAAVLGVLCFFWSAGMVSDSDYDGEGSSLYLDPEKAKRAKVTSEYVWRFILYVTIAYLVLFLKLRLRRSPQDEALPKLNETLTPEVVSEIVATMGGHVANRPRRYGRESDLPYPRVVIETAFLKALRDAPEGSELETLKTFYTFLDDHMLSDADSDALNRWHEFLTAGAAEARLLDDPVALANGMRDAGSDRAVELMQELSKKAHERLRAIETIRGA
jgi:hypothetical protein